MMLLTLLISYRLAVSKCFTIRESLMIQDQQASFSLIYAYLVIYPPLTSMWKHTSLQYCILSGESDCRRFQTKSYIIMSDYSEQSSASEYSNSDSDYGTPEKSRKKKKQIVMNFVNAPSINARITINLALTHYDVIEEVAEELEWKIIRKLKSKTPWDILWTDHHIQPDLLIKLQLYQKVSHFPGIHVLSRKNLLGLSFMDMYRRAPEHYNFFPRTWLLPSQFSELRKEFTNEEKTFIVKPEADCQGKGIFLTQKIQDVGNGGHYVVQQYIEKPFLIDGLKFDFRVYVLFCGVSPLRLYIYEEGLARFATEAYVEPNKNNLKKQYIHLTNYAINKKNPKFVFNSSSQRMDVGHKRALTSVMKLMEKKGYNLKKLKGEINEAIVKTLLLGHPLVAHQYRFCQPNDENRNMCFHILGIDVMLDSECKPFVLEVNHTPSFVADTPLDRYIKFSLIKDTLILMNITPDARAKAVEKMNQIQKERIMGRQKRQLYENMDKQERVRMAQDERTKYQGENIGRFTRIYPVEDEEKTCLYEYLLQVAQKSYFSQNNVLRAQMERQKADDEASTNLKQRQREFEKEQKSKKPAFFQSQTSTTMPIPPLKLRKLASSNDYVLRQSQTEGENKGSPVKRERISSFNDNSKKKTLIMEMREIERLKDIETELAPYKMKNQFKPSAALIKKSPSINSKSVNPKALPKIGHETIPAMNLSPLKKEYGQLSSPYRNRKIKVIKLVEDDKSSNLLPDKPRISQKHQTRSKIIKKSNEDEQQSEDDD